MEGKAVVAWHVIHRERWETAQAQPDLESKMKRDLIAVALMYALDLFKVDLAAPRAWHRSSSPGDCIAESVWQLLLKTRFDEARLASTRIH